MAIVFDNATHFSSTTGGASHTFAHTVNDNTNGLLLVFVSQQGNVTGITYNAVALTSTGINSTDSTDSAVNGGCWYLAAPASGANNVVVSWSPNTNAQGLGAISYTGVRQTGSIGAVSGPAKAHGTSVSDNITSTVANSMIVDRGIQYNDANGYTQGGSQTSRVSGSDAGFPLSMGLSEQAAPTIQAYTMSWSGADASNHVLHELIEILPPAVAATAAKRPGSTLLMMGV